MKKVKVEYVNEELPKDAVILGQDTVLISTAYLNEEGDLILEDYRVDKFEEGEPLRHFHIPVSQIPTLKKLLK